jgi:hypothetical protein
MLYEAPLVAEAVNVIDWPLQIAAVAGVKDTAGNALTVTSAALALVAEHPAAVFTYRDRNSKRLSSRHTVL